MLVARPPVVGAALIDGRVAGTVAVLLAGIGVTAFDGASEGPLFNDLLPDLQDLFAALGLGPAQALELGFAVGLFATIGLVALIWAARRGRRASWRTPRADPRRLRRRALLLAARLQRPGPRRGWHPTRSATARTCSAAPARAIDYGVVSATAIWYVQVAALVLGHVAALVLAHDRALVLYGSQRAATRSQIVMLVLMVCFTCLGLWLLSAANG